MDTNGIRLVDCHLHLQDGVLLREAQAVVERARAAGVERLVCNGAWTGDWEAVLKLAERFEDVVPFLGVHPWRIDECEADWLERLEELAGRYVFGIGEVGLDHVRKIDRDLQAEVFRRQVQLAKSLERPLNVHCVHAWGALAEVIGEAGALPGGWMVHSFAGSVEAAREIEKAGGYLSFSAWALTDKRREKTAAVLRAVSPERVLVETDSPFGMGPGRLHLQVIRDEESREWNEPANLPAAVRELAELAGEDAARFARQTTENARRFLAPLEKQR